MTIIIPKINNKIRTRTYKRYNPTKCGSLRSRNTITSKIYRQTTIDRLLRYKHGHNGEGPKNPYVLYYGDYDPSGLRMSQNIQRDLAAYGINFVRVGLVHQQISEFGLDYLRNPDPEAMAKLSRQESKHGQ